MPATEISHSLQLTDFASVGDAKRILRKHGSSPWQEVTRRYRRSTEHLQQLLEALGGKHQEGPGILSNVQAMCSICPSTDKRIDSRLASASTKVQLIHSLALELERELHELHGFVEKDLSHQIEQPAMAHA